jgi:hypothetical protein
MKENCFVGGSRTLFCCEYKKSVFGKISDSKLTLNHIFKVLRTSFNLPQNIKGSSSLMTTPV